MCRGRAKKVPKKNGSLQELGRGRLMDRRRGGAKFPPAGGHPWQSLRHWAQLLILAIGVQLNQNSMGSKTYSIILITLIKSLWFE